jgi:hypothetical protein
MHEVRFKSSLVIGAVWKHSLAHSFSLSLYPLPFVEAAVFVIVLAKPVGFNKIPPYTLVLQGP